MNHVLEGELTRWALCEQGQWWGLVTYPIRHGAETKRVTHWISAWVLKPRP